MWDCLFWLGVARCAFHIIRLQDSLVSMSICGKNQVIFVFCMKIDTKGRYHLRVPLLVRCGQLCLLSSQIAGLFDHQYLCRYNLIFSCYFRRLSFFLQLVRVSNRVYWHCKHCSWEGGSLRGVLSPLSVIQGYVPESVEYFCHMNIWNRLNEFKQCQFSLITGRFLPNN